MTDEAGAMNAAALEFSAHLITLFDEDGDFFFRSSSDEARFNHLLKVACVSTPSVFGWSN